MKNNLQIFTLAVATIVTSAARADETANSSPNAASADVKLAPNMMDAHLGRTTKATELTGENVKNNQEVNLGKVKDLAVDVEAGRIVYVLISAGGVMGVGGTVSAVPPGALHQEATNNDVLHLDVRPGQLQMTKFDMANWEQSCSTNQIAEVYARYGQEPFFIINENTANTNLMTPHQIDLLNHNQPMIQPVRLGHVERASKVIGLPVSNFQDEKVGKVENLVVDLPAGRVVALVVSSGGYWGMNGELSAIPASAFRYNAETNGLRLDVSKETLNNAPHFSSSQWPDVDEAYAATVYRAYSVPAYFTNRYAVDNTAQNSRDRHGGTFTPLDQGNSDFDIHVTAEIRKRIMAHDEFSTYAHNVKVITRDGKVTLRGPVNTLDEKNQIGEIADGIVGAANVDNQLEVRVSVSSNH